ncbi:MAG TPA: hypothetical protein VGI40_05590 [Pirellulaceae bacterium]|jgi:hypothetical protein
MLTELNTFSTQRPSFGRRPRAMVPCTLPDSQALLDLSLREFETTIDEWQGKLQALSPQLADGLLRNQEHLDRARHVLHGICAGLLKHLEVIQERMAARHHPQGRFGATVGKLQAEVRQQINCLHVDQEQLGELSAEQRSELAGRRLNEIAETLRHAVVQIGMLLQGIRNANRQPHSITLGSVQHPPQERQHLRDQLAWSLRQWWQTCTVQPGPMTIAVIDLNRLASDYPELSCSAAEELLQAAASLVVSDRRTGRAGISIDTTVTSATGQERQLAWSCAVIEDQRGSVQSIIAAGLDKTNTKPAKAAIKSIAAVAQAASSMSAASQPAEAERRRKQRNPFPYVQLLAPYAGTGLPPTSAFVEALCHDISEDGFSFLSAAMPSSTSLVVALGTRPPHLYMTARVAHFTRCDTVCGEKYIVGCQFTGRAMVMAQFA